MAPIERRKTLTMNWDGLDDDDDMHFFETYNRLSTAVPDDLASSSDEDEDYEDSRISFSSAVSAFHPAKHRKPELPPATTITPNYDIWMAAPGSITERRRRLLGSMGLVDNKENLKATSEAIGRAITKKKLSSSSSTVAAATSSGGSIQKITEQSPVQYVLVRSRSEGDIDFFSMAKLRKEEMIGKISKQRLTRTSTEIGVPCTRARHVDGNRIIARDPNETSMRQLPPMSPMVTPGTGGVGAFFLIKNLDTGKEFIVKEYGENGTWNRLSDLETGKQLTMEEFEKTVGHSPFIKDIMRRGNYGRHDGYGKKLASNSAILRSLKLSKKKSASLLKNIKGVASGIVGERERSEMAAPQVVEQPQHKKPEGKNKWVKVKQNGKSQKDLSALHLCQEFQAHEGCIWTIRFSLDGRFLASAGEDKVIHVWEVQECEVMSMEEGHLTPIHPSLMSSMERGVEPPNLGKKKGKFGSKRGGSAAIPEYVHVPENVFTFSEKPYCSFHGHLDEVLDLSWSRSQVSDVKKSHTGCEMT
ncbi:WD repeat-containing protein 44-like [Trifolium pratense]|uniref:WD repeat-containing protein 44-like n=1 Tax=Trifolium pratense TaxID=57577 RepID=A0A2K3LCD2_TRIPR|nr:WD repeat-containing protein 44-like [Trifolium pratense]